MELEMFSGVFARAMESGFIAVLFVALLVYTLRDARKREMKYQEVIHELQKSLIIVKDIHKDVSDIKDAFDQTKSKL